MNAVLEMQHMKKWREQWYKRVKVIHGRQCKGNSEYND